MDRAGDATREGQAGEEVVRDGRLARADEDEIAREHRAHAARFVA